MKTGAITTLAIPKPTAGYIECCGKKTKEEKKEDKNDSIQSPDREEEEEVEDEFDIKSSESKLISKD